MLHNRQWPPVRRASIVSSGRAWIGTPYRHQASVRGVGCDCLGFIRGIWRDVCGPEPEASGGYSRDWGEASGRETLLSAARRHFIPIDPDRAQAGDLLFFRMRYGAIVKHVGLLSQDGWMLHAQEGYRVADVKLGVWWQRRIAAAFQFPNVVD